MSDPLPPQRHTYHFLPGLPAPDLAGQEAATQLAREVALGSIETAKAMLPLTVLDADAEAVRTTCIGELAAIPKPQRDAEQLGQLRLLLTEALREQELKELMSIDTEARTVEERWRIEQIVLELTMPEPSPPSRWLAKHKRMRRPRTTSAKGLNVTLPSSRHSLEAVKHLRM